MAFDEDLANRVREILGPADGLTERRMFGGLAFLVRGHMSVAVSRQGGLLVRVDPDETPALLRRPNVDAFEMRGRALEGWVRVDAAGVRTKRQLEGWVARGIGHARTLPPKPEPAIRREQAVRAAGRPRRA